MRRSLRTLLAYALVLVCVDSGFSQTGSPEKRLTADREGYSFSVPTGFNAKQTDEGFGLVDTAKTVIIILKAHEYQTFEKFSAEANLERDGLTLLGKIQDVAHKGKAFRTFKQTPQGNVIVDTFVLFSPSGGGLLVVALSDNANNEKSFQAALKIANSVAFTNPVSSGDVEQWQGFLRGKHLMSASSSAGGFSQSTHIYLCPSGLFSFGSDSLSNSINGTGSVASGSGGRWEISTRGGTTLILRYRDGTQRAYRISRRPDPAVVDLDGTRYLVKPFSGCPE